MMISLLSHHSFNPSAKHFGSTFKLTTSLHPCITAPHPSHHHPSLRLLQRLLTGLLASTLALQRSSFSTAVSGALGYQCAALLCYKRSQCLTASFLLLKGINTLLPQNLCPCSLPQKLISPIPTSFLHLLIRLPYLESLPSSSPANTYPAFLFSFHLLSGSCI